MITSLLLCNIAWLCEYDFGYVVFFSVSSIIYPLFIAVSRLPALCHTLQATVNRFDVA